MNPFNLLRTVLAALMPAVLAPRFELAARRAATVTACTVLAGLLAAAAVGCLIAALWLALAPAVGRAGAGAICALLLLAVAVVLIQLPRIQRRRTVATPVLPHLSTESLLSEAAHLFKDHKFALLAAMLVVGTLLGARSRHGGE